MEITKEQEERILALDANFFNKKLEVGKWYRYINENYTDWLMNYQEGENNCYGFNSSKSYRTCYTMNSGTNWIPATHQEVEDALIVEAKKRGYAKGNFVSLSTSKMSNYDAYRVMFDENNNKFWSKYGLVFQNGKWAEIIETITKAEAEKLLNKIII